MNLKDSSPKKLELTKEKPLVFSKRVFGGQNILHRYGLSTTCSQFRFDNKRFHLAS